ncbi:hypothetical protein QFC21_001091 [Naganishia friedmannii]|uniref:Uncharacterized protein n=1 Tax=Naganishia friedmannii TaxID=89922 RepID=A0ACC2W8A3_9TREE|nr:hypothetical protein QFC21_001091 [Naganishia friedmannii]
MPSNSFSTQPMSATRRRSIWRRVPSACWPFLCCLADNHIEEDDDDAAAPSRRHVRPKPHHPRRTDTLQISHPRPLRPKSQAEKDARTHHQPFFERLSFMFMPEGHQGRNHTASTSQARDTTTPHAGYTRTHSRTAEREQVVSLTTLSTEDLHLLEEYKYRARAGSWAHGSRSTSRTEGENERHTNNTTPDVGGSRGIPLRNLLGELEAEEDGEGKTSLSAGWIPHRERARSRSPPELYKAGSRDYISLRSGTPYSVRSENTPPPPPPPPAPAAAAFPRPQSKSPLSTQHPWTTLQHRRSIRHVGSCEDDSAEMMMMDIFTPLPLEIDMMSPFDVDFQRLVVDAGEDGQGGLAAGKEEETERLQDDEQRLSRLIEQQLQPTRMPSRPKLVHFATTPSLFRHVEGNTAGAQPESVNAGDKPARPPSRIFTPVNEPSASRRVSTSSYRSISRPFTPVRNVSHSPPTTSSYRRRSLSKTWTREMRASIHRDLIPAEPAPQRRTRPDPALFPGVIPYSFSPRDMGLRKQEKEWKQYNSQQLQNVRSLPGSEGASKSTTTRRKHWSWSGVSKRRNEGVERQRLAESEDEVERIDDEWEVLQ